MTGPTATECGRRRMNRSGVAAGAEIKLAGDQFDVVPRVAHALSHQVRNSSTSAVPAEIPSRQPTKGGQMCSHLLAKPMPTARTARQQARRQLLNRPDVLGMGLVRIRIWIVSHDPPPWVSSAVMVTQITRFLTPAPEGRTGVAYHRACRGYKQGGNTRRGARHRCGGTVTGSHGLRTKPGPHPPWGVTPVTPLLNLFIVVEKPGRSEGVTRQ